MKVIFLNNAFVADILIKACVSFSLSVSFRTFIFVVMHLLAMKNLRTKICQSIVFIAQIY